MRYYRCKCGDRESWSSMGAGPVCEGCTLCNTTLASHPDYHGERAAHEFTLEAHSRGFGEEVTAQVCRFCHRSEKELTSLK